MTCWQRFPVISGLKVSRGKRGEPMLNLTVSGEIPLVASVAFKAIQFDLDVDNLWK